MFNFLKRLFGRKPKAPPAPPGVKKSSALHRLQRECARDAVRVDLQTAKLARPNQ